METAKLDYNLPFRAFLKHLDEVDMEICKGKKNESAVHGYYPYVRASLSCYSNNQVISAVLVEPDRTFLDVGCGTGRILALRKYLTGSQVLGIEIISELAIQGSKVYDVPILIGDAFKLITKKLLKKIHVVYSYMPIRNVKMMRKLEQVIEENTTDWMVRVELLPEYFVPRPTRTPLIFQFYGSDR